MTNAARAPRHGRASHTHSRALGGGQPRHDAARQSSRFPRPITADDLRRAAISYARRGWAVLPLHTIEDGACTCSAGADCTSPGKHPVAGGVHSATTDTAEVERLWRQHPGANIGIATGRASDLIVLDVDRRNGGFEAARALQEQLGTPPRTVASNTGGGGRHLFYRYPISEPCPTRHRLGLDLQSDGAFVVAPPSRHASGGLYRWREGRGPAFLPLATFPESWLRHLRGSSPAAASPASLTTSGAIGEGSRNTHLTRRAGAMRQAGLSADAILAALKVENAERCVPPLDEAELARIAGSVGKYAAGTAGGGDEAEQVMEVLLHERYAGGAHLLRAADGQFWHFTSTHWARVSRDDVRRNALEVIRATPRRRGPGTASLMNQVLSLLEARVAAQGDPLRFEADPLPVINVRTGELWIRPDGSVELKPHDPASGLRHCCEVDYDPAATCPRYDEALLGIFGKAPDPEAMIDFWHDLLGYAMQADRREPLILIGHGKGNNGKTKLIQTWVRVVGPSQVVAMPIGQIDRNQFSTGNLLGKLGILDDDVKAGTRLPDGPLKRLSEEKTVTGEVKFGAQFTFTSRTAIILLCNNPPSIADLSHGLRRRIVVVPFDRKFTKAEADKGLFREIWANEMAGVLNRYLAGLRRVIGRGWAFDPPEAARRAKADFLEGANPLPTFIAEKCERTGSAYVGRLFESYREWAMRAGVTITQQRLAFTRNLEHLGYKLGRGNEGSKVYGLRLCADAPCPRRP